MPSENSDVGGLTFTPSAQAVGAEVREAEENAEGEVTSLFTAFRTPLLRYVLAFGLRSDDGEDIVQDVFLYLYRHIQSGRSRHNLRGWIFRVAHNLALKRNGSNRKRQAELVAGDNGESAVQHVDPAPNPEEQLSAERRKQKLLAVVAALPKQDQMCLYLRAEGLRYREISKVLGVSLGTVSNSLARSLERMGRADEQ